MHVLAKNLENPSAVNPPDEHIFPNSPAVESFNARGLCEWVSTSGTTILSLKDVEPFRGKMIAFTFAGFGGVQFGVPSVSSIEIDRVEVHHFVVITLMPTHDSAKSRLSLPVSELKNAKLIMLPIDRDQSSDSSKKV